MNITMAHGAGGETTERLITEIFMSAFQNKELLRSGDCALLPGAERIAVTTDSFVVQPVIYPGGDIGRLSVCGTVNDLLAGGAEPKYLTAGFILETGLELNTLKLIADSMAETAREAGVMIVAGDTKVIGGKGGLMINTAGFGIVPEGREIGPEMCRPGDALLISGTLGDHHAAILGKRMGIKNDIVSDNAPLREMVETLFVNGIRVHAMRDVTRGGLATILNELAKSSKVCFELEEKALPVSESVHSFAGLLGLDPLYMGNEGRMLFSVDEADAEKALELIRKSRYGENAARIGGAAETHGYGTASAPSVILKTLIGGRRILKALVGEGLPRIC
ncbi:MAG: hydrogenase expression/formation protein HypE [Lachnospiraceae bacterium]|nr:hydrogenase expression/formation protein HypE [Lachnospiraceae bacterium]